MLMRIVVSQLYYKKQAIFYQHSKLVAPLLQSRHFPRRRRHGALRMHLLLQDRSIFVVKALQWRNWMSCSSQRLRSQCCITCQSLRHWRTRDLIISMLRCRRMQLLGRKSRVQSTDTHLRMEINWLIVAQRSSLVSDLHQTNVEEEVAEADHTEIHIVAEGAEDMETGHHTEHMRAFVRPWIREMTGIGVIKRLRWRNFAFWGVCGFDCVLHCASAMGLFAVVGVSRLEGTIVVIPKETEALKSRAEYIHDFPASYPHFFVKLYNLRFPRYEAQASMDQSFQGRKK